jgi:tetratricopeptide (TPR) repeat protein/predicted Ser/Thr protein kinase
VTPQSELHERLESSLGDTFAIERELGGGGMSRVFLARERALDRRVVVKVLHPELSGVNVDRFRREIQVVARLQHPHIVPVLAAGEAQGILYFTMPYIDGESLRAWLVRELRLPVEDVLRIMHDVADALAYAHERGVVHRDIKPDNVLVSRRHAMVTDFGVAKALTAAARGTGSDNGGTGVNTTGSGLAIGTPAYMAPEQAAGDPSTDHRADIYAFGVLAYELLAGRAPFTARPPSEILAAHIAEQPQPIETLRSDVPPALAALVAACLAKRPDDRPQTAAQVRSAIEALATPGAGTVIGPSVTRRKSARRAVAFTVATALLLVVSAIAYSRRPAAQPPTDQNLVAVAPFRVSSTDASLKYLREGMLDLMSAKLTGATGPRSADPRSLLMAWRRAAGADTADLPRARALDVAESLGAGQLLIGAVTGDSSHITLHAVLVRVSDGRALPPAQVEGHPDSLPKLVDMLAAQLLATGAGEEDALSTLTSTSLPALRSFLNGQWLYRRGRYRDAAREYATAIDLDSTFALSALRLAVASNWFGVPAMRQTGLRLAWAGRDRLAPRDRALLDATAGPHYPAASSYLEILKAKERYVSVAPDRADAWFELGDGLFHMGAVVGYPDAEARAADAFERALALDSTYAPAAEHLLLIEAHRGDTSAVRRLGAHFLSIDPASENADGVRWRVAVALGDSASLSAITRRTDTLTPISAHTMAYMSQVDAVDLDRAQRVADAAVENARQQSDRYVALLTAHDLALNRGRPSAAVVANTRARDVAASARVSLRERVRDALYWDGDSAAAATAVRELERTAFGPTPEKPADRFGQVVDLCNVELWRAGHDDSRTLATSVARLRRIPVQGADAAAAAFAQSCAMLLDAVAATGGGRTDAPVAVARLDSMLKTGPGGFVQDAGNLILARLKERRGDVRGALAAVRRRETFLTRPLYLSTFLREEGRLAALAGENDAAIEAYRHYLALRASPEPMLQSEAEFVRDELEKLEKAGGAKE